MYLSTKSAAGLWRRLLEAAGLGCLLLIAAWTAGCGSTPSEGCGVGVFNPQGNGPVLVFAAASATSVLDELKTRFSRRTGIVVRTSCAASSTLAQQIVNGAGADLFLSADMQWADYVESQIPVARRRNLLAGRLVIVVPADSQINIRQPADLLSDRVKHLALADPAGVPAGKYAKQALVKLGIWEKLRAKVVPAEDVRQALVYVEMGAAEAGIVYATDAAVSKRVKVAVEIDANLTDPVRYPLLLLKHGTDNHAAQSFYDYLCSPEATKVFQKAGFVVCTASLPTS